MLITQFSVSTIIFFVGVWGILTHRRNIIVILMCIELILLGVNVNLILMSVYLDDMTGQVWSIFILTVAAAEAAVGLAILIAYYRQRGHILLTGPLVLKY